MNPVSATIVLILLAAVLFLLPMLPAILEFRRKRDAQPLNVIQQYAGDIRHFAHTFRDRVRQLDHQLRDCASSGKTFATALPNGDECVILGRGDAGRLLTPWLSKSACRHVMVASTDQALPDGLTFLKETYALGALRGGKGSVFRAILGEQDIRLLEDSKVLRWAHAVRVLDADSNCGLFGRISSEAEIVLHPGCVFQRLNAPRIASAPSGQGDSGSPHASRAFVLGPSADLASRPRSLFDEDVEICSGEVFLGNLVTRGSLRIGSGARVCGSVKSNRRLIVESGAAIEGSLISADTMEIGPDCRIHGPVLAERSLSLASGAVCGDIQSPTTVSAPSIEIEPGVLVFGTLWARELGRVLPLK
jgi:cytoskeletal protein CcmA (bactofilin family)